MVPLSITQERRKRILIVEDNIALRFTLAEWLRSLKYTVFEATSADEAIVLLESPLEVDLVVTDVQMPGKKDGIELLRYIQNSLPAVKVIVVSGDVHEVLKGEKVPFLKKPYDLEEMASNIAKLLTGSN